MEVLWALICGLFILLGFEIRIRYMAEDIADLKLRVINLADDLASLEERMKGKRDALEKI